ncbi:MAG: site-specific integrase [Bryobacterales bacterium]
MKGSVRKLTLPSGTVVWRLQVDAGRDEHGKRIRINKSFSKKGEAEDSLTRLLQERAEGSLVKPSPQTFGEFLAEWLREYAQRNVSPKTAERYGQLAQYAIDGLGSVALQELSTLTLERFYSQLRDGKGKSGKPLAPRTVRHVHDTLRGALNTALRWRLLKVNPAIPCRLPRIERQEARIVEDAQLGALIDAARNHAWAYAMLVLDSATGLRRGELCGLRWPDADLDGAALTVARSLEQTKAGLRIKPPKNGKTRRLTLPAAAVDVLREHKQAQQRNRRLFGKDYSTDLDLIFCSPNGDYLKPNTVSPAIAELAARVGLKGIGLHSLRHTHGSQLLAAGVPLPTVSKRLGHSSVAVTAAIYAHAFAADEIAAADAWEARLGDSIRKASKPRLQVVARGKTG